MDAKKKRGFAVLDPERHREICSQGGKASHATGRAHRFTTEEAKAAGAKGGRTCKDRHGLEHYSEIGKKSHRDLAERKALR